MHVSKYRLHPNNTYSFRYQFEKEEEKLNFSAKKKRCKTLQGWGGIQTIPSVLISFMHRTSFTRNKLFLHHLPLLNKTCIFLSLIKVLISYTDRITIKRQ